MEVQLVQGKSAIIYKVEEYLSVCAMWHKIAIAITCSFSGNFAFPPGVHIGR